MDKERQDLSDDLAKIRTDFCEYQRETQGKVEQKENLVKSLITELDRLKEEMCESDSFRQQLMVENNELQKQITHENVVIPQLESELKTLSQENDYLKLLGKATAEKAV